MQVTTDYKRMRAALDSCQWDHMRMLADAAEDCGDMTLAKGWRWLADNKRWPDHANIWETSLPPTHRRRQQVVFLGWRFLRELHAGAPLLLKRLPSDWLPFDLLVRLNDLYRDGGESWGGRVDDDSPLLGVVLDITAECVGDWLASKDN